MRSRLCLILVLFTLGFAGCASRDHDAPARDPERPYLTQEDIAMILANAQTAAGATPSLLRVSPDTGAQQTCRMHIFVVDRLSRIVDSESMPDAWLGSIAIARSKAFTALAFSSDKNALTTRSLGALSQPGGPLWQIGNSNRGHGVIEFPGGVPLYKDGHLVGAIGVSGDGVDQDETVAVAGAEGFAPPAPIRIDAVTGGGVPYTK